MYKKSPAITGLFLYIIFESRNKSILAYSNKRATYYKAPPFTSLTAEPVSNGAQATNELIDWW